MKKIYYLFITALLFISCGQKEASIDDLIANKDIAALQARKTKLNETKKTLEQDLKKLSDYLAKNSGETIKKDVSAIIIKDSVFTHYTELQGSVATKQNILISPEAAGLLTHVYVKEGQRVSKGQRLARIDDSGMAQSLEQMKVQAQLAQTTYERQKRLWEQNIGSEMQYLQAKTNYEAQQKSINAMQEQLAKTIVTAPFSGTIDDVITEQGNVVMPGSPLLRLVNLKDMYIQVDVPENYLTSIKKGTKVQVDFPAITERMESHIRQTSSVINPANRSFSIEIPVKNTTGNVKPNLTARLKINDYTSPNAIMVPLSVISENQNGEQYVMIVAQSDKGTIAKRRPVTTGLSKGDLVEITSGLQTGDLLITEGARTVQEDQEIAVKKA